VTASIETNSIIRLLCVEDDPLVRVFLTTRLAAEPDFELVGAVPDIERALIDLRRSEIDVVLLDFHLLGRTGTELLQVMSPWTRWCEAAEHRPAILFCTGFANEAFEAQARLLGARGVVAKERMASDLIPAVRAVAAGDGWYGNQFQKLS
jgi:DNA-binding NarL/FixJ family response regulator